MDTLPDFRPVMLSGLSWAMARANLGCVDCAIRRDHWCSPVVILLDGKPVVDDDGEIKPFTFMRGDRAARDWSMVPRVDDNGNEIAPTFRTQRPIPDTEERKLP